MITAIPFAGTPNQTKQKHKAKQTNKQEICRWADGTHTENNKENYGKSTASENNTQTDITKGKSC